ncbi:tetratricopeptide repeat (TPR)-like superfamily protein [Actinidia rufa]|uniref:Tetratricopeptide repeat (TPR)-like superfamily protein n=1 Tax=Actinidia rufa TaxID=165716 RepID=A0A7J0GFI7_9ERIC|nr:tetratricopeptide repeat (TPR)-like superfamily protein [Actinidia rufa]
MPTVTPFAVEDVYFWFPFYHLSYLTKRTPTCTKLYELRVGRVIHGQIVKANEDPDQVVYNALLRLYAECGCFKDVLRVFNEMSERDIATWNSFIGGYVKLDQLLEAFDTFRSMQGEGVGFSWVTLTTMLPRRENQGGDGSSEEHANEADWQRMGNYVMLLNIYASVGLWEGVNMVREMMEKRGIKEAAGCSWIQVKNRLHTFVAGGGFELCSSNDYKTTWDELAEAMKAVGHSPDTRVVRLATMFGLIHTGSRLPIRITKNLRVCVSIVTLG